MTAVVCLFCHYKLRSHEGTVEKLQGPNTSLPVIQDRLTVCGFTELNQLQTS